VSAEVGGRIRPRCGSCEFVLYQNPAAAAAGVVLNACGEILLVRRALEPYRGHWALPAGYQELDEDPCETVRREVLEESGIEVEVIGLLDLLFVPEDPRKPANVAVYLCRACGGELFPGDDASEAGWFPLGALPEPIGFENLPRILERLDPLGTYPESPWSQLRALLSGRGGPAQ
jgi:ADP-ribose pyrophosphatase YjhB (NUDIX family)